MSRWILQPMNDQLLQQWSFVRKEKCHEVWHSLAPMPEYHKTGKVDIRKTEVRKPNTAINLYSLPLLSQLSGDWVAALLCLFLVFLNLCFYWQQETWSVWYKRGGHSAAGDSCIYEMSKRIKPPHKGSSSRNCNGRTSWRSSFIIQNMRHMSDTPAH